MNCTHRLWIHFAEETADLTSLDQNLSANKVPELVQYFMLRGSYPVSTLTGVSIVSKTEHQLVAGLSILPQAETRSVDSAREAEIGERRRNDMKSRPATLFGLRKEWKAFDYLVKAARPWS